MKTNLKFINYYLCNESIYNFVLMLNFCQNTLTYPIQRKLYDDDIFKHTNLWCLSFSSIISAIIRR